MNKHWIATAVEYLTQSLEPVPHEINELDWKSNLSPEKDRLIAHLIAFANHPNGGFLAYGIRDADVRFVGVQQDEVASQVVTNTTIRNRFKLHEKHRTIVSNLLTEAARKGRIKRKDPDATSSKFVEYVPYWA